MRRAVKRRRRFLLLARSAVSGRRTFHGTLKLSLSTLGSADHPEWILLCDGCEDGWHLSCLRPALMVIPEGDWYVWTFFMSATKSIFIISSLLGSARLATTSLC